MKIEQLLASIVDPVVDMYLCKKIKHPLKRAMAYQRLRYKHAILK